MEKVFAAQCIEEKKKLDNQRSDIEKIVQQYGNVLSKDLAKVCKSVELKKSSIQDHFEKNKDSVKVTFSDILARITEAKLKFDFSEALKHTRCDKIRDFKIYNSDSAGVKDWSYPSDSKMSWDNPLTAIIKHTSNSEFNFVFKNGETSDVPMSK